MRSITALSLAAAIAAGATPALARGGDFQVVRSGDAALSCEALAAEMNTLGQAVNARQAEAAAKTKKSQNNRRLLGFAASAMSGALPGLASQVDSPVGYYVAQSAASAIQQQAQASATNAMLGGDQPAPAAAVATVPEQARFDHLAKIQSGKGC